MEIALPLLFVRLVLGFAFAAHGTQKLFGWFGGYGLAGTGGFLETLGFRPGRVFAAAAGVSELTGGLLIAFGLGGPVGPMLAIAAMLVAIVTVHLRNGFFAASNGIELPALYLLFGLVYAFAGYGALSLDAALGIASVWTAGVVWGVVVLGFAGGLLNLAARRKAPSAPTVTESLDPAV
jgi:putative oxidoreductase